MGSSWNEPETLRWSTAHLLFGLSCLPVLTRFLRYHNAEESLTSGSGPTNGRCWQKTRKGRWEMPGYFSFLLSLLWTVSCPFWQWPHLLYSLDAHQLCSPRCQGEPWCLTLAPSIDTEFSSVSRPRVVMSSCLDHLCVISPAHLVSQLFEPA